jgi:hypothetical protein
MLIWFGLSSALFMLSDLVVKLYFIKLSYLYNYHRSKQRAFDMIVFITISLWLRLACVREDGGANGAKIRQ